MNHNPQSIRPIHSIRSFSRGDEAWPRPGEALLEGAESGAVHRQHRGAAEAFEELQRQGRVPLLADVRMSGIKQKRNPQQKASYRHVHVEKCETELYVQICAETCAQSIDMICSHFIWIHACVEHLKLHPAQH